MENFKRSVKRLITRLTVLGLVVICGAIAIAQANRDRIAANADTPDLTEPGAAFNDVGNALTGTENGGLTAVEFDNDDAPPMPVLAPVVSAADAAKKLAAKTVDVVEDASVQPAQAVENVVDRFARPFRLGDSKPGSERTNPARVGSLDKPVRASAESRFDPPGASQPFLPETSKEVANQAGNAAAAPEFLTDDFPPPPINGAPVPPPSTQTPEFPARNNGPDFGNSATPGNGVFDTADQPRTPRRFGNQPVARSSNMSSEPAFARESRPADTAPVVEEASRNSTTPTNNRFGAHSFNSGADSSPVDLTAPQTRATFLDNGTTQDDALTTGQVSDSSNMNLERNDSLTGGSFGATDFETSVPSATQHAATGQPGPRGLEGVQNTALSIHKTAPRNVRVGSPATFRIKVRNNSQVTAERVIIRDEVPEGTQLIDTNPTAVHDSSGALIWQIGTLPPGQNVEVSMQVEPSVEGVIGSVASVTHETLASARVDVKKPMLKIVHTTKETALLGDQVQFIITIENPGSGPAENVVIEEEVPRGLSHQSGPRLHHEVGTIPAGGQHRVELTLKAAEAGRVENIIMAKADGGLTAEHRVNLDVVAPKLNVQIDGPKRRYLERKATFAVAIKNPGTADARNVDLSVRLPKGLKFVSTNNSGRFDPATNTIRWSLDRLPARQYGEVQFTALPMQKGEYRIGVDAKAQKGLQDAAEHPLSVDGIAALLFEVADQVDPIEIGGVTTYQIRVRNQGTKEANNIQFEAMLPPGLKALPAEGRSKYAVRGDRILFAPIAKLPAKGEASYTVRIEGTQAGDHRFTVQMKSDETTTPVVEEESTRVYAD